jgi:ParB/RepB/Spo0J family partition protein
MAKTTGLASLSQRSSAIEYIDPRVIKVRDNWNDRDFTNPENAQYVEDMCASIIEGGVKEPLTVTMHKGEVWLEHGECRLRGAMLAIERGTTGILVPVKSEEKFQNEVDKLVSHRLRNSGKPFTVFEDAAFFKRLYDHGLSEEIIARKCNISKAQVTRILEFNTVGKVGKDAVLNGEASASLVLEATKELGSEAEQALLKGLKEAKKSGKKLKPDQVPGLNRVNIKTAVKDAFEYAHIDDSAENEVVITMPMDKWDVIKDILKL